MNRCTRAIASDCDDRDLVLVRLFMRHTDQLVCAKCRAALERAGASFTVVERRVEERPVWLRHLRAKDRTGELVA